MRATAFTFDISNSAISSTLIARRFEGLGIKSIAPNSSALNVASAPYCVSTLIIMTGFGFVFMISCNASSPSIMGISISIVITSGLRVRFLNTADLPLFAVPITSISLSLSRISVMTFLTRAESSTTMTLIFCDIEINFATFQLSYLMMKLLALS